MKLDKDDKMIDKYSIFSSILVAVYISIPVLNQIVIAIFPKLSGKAMTLLYALTIVGVLLMGCNTFRHGAKVHTKLFLYTLGILFVYLLTCCFAPYTRLNVTDFISYTIVALIIPMILRLDGKCFIKATMLCSLPAIFFLNKIFEISNGMYQTITMGVSYAFFPSIIASIVYLFLYFKLDNKRARLIGAMAIVINFVFFIQVLQYGSRGPIFCVGTCICFLLCFRYKKNGVEVVAFKFIILACIVLYAIVNIWTVLEWLQSFFAAYGIQLNVIEKFYRLAASTNDMSNGRLGIAKEVWNAIIESPIWGHGMSTTKHNLGIVYPHNFILQLLYDGGVILAFPILFSMLYGIICILKSCTYNEYAVVCALFFMSVPSALLSGDLWESNRLWLTIAVLILGRKLRRFVL